MSDAAAPTPSAGTANDVRGEVDILLEGVNYVMRPSFDAIQAIEKKLGRGLLELGQAAYNNTLSTIDIATIATLCIHAEGKAKNDQSMQHFDIGTVAPLLHEEPGGFMIAALRIQRLLLNASTGGYTATGEPKAATGTMMTTETPAAA